jgi:hypothetical protein
LGNNVTMNKYKPASLDGCPMFALAYMGRRGQGVALPTLLFCDLRRLVHGVKAFEKHRFRPMYATANMGHPSRTIGFGLSKNA